MVSPMKHFQNFNTKRLMTLKWIPIFLFSKSSNQEQLLSVRQRYFKCLICLLILCHLYSDGMNSNYIAVYYKNIMYYISTNPNAKVVMHYLDQGNKNRIIENSQIPNQHLHIADTITLQGTFELINFCFHFRNCLFFKTYLGNQIHIDKQY